VRHEQIVGDLPALLRGELSRDRLDDVVDHLELPVDAVRARIAQLGLSIAEATDQPDAADDGLPTLFP
jgi:hypothetical protein